MFIHRWCVAYVMGHFIEKDLDDFKEYWNSHMMRCDRKIGKPSARPNDLYDMPETYGTLCVIT